MPGRGNYAAIREYFRFLEGVGVIAQIADNGDRDTQEGEKYQSSTFALMSIPKCSPWPGQTPETTRSFRYFLQTGIRVSELANLTIDDVDFIKPAITVRGKGSVEREIALEKRGMQALKNYLAVRPGESLGGLFLNYQGEPISERGIRKLVVKYRKAAGITKKASCHTLRHTFATYKAEKGVSPFQLQQWLGHANLNTTQIYVHLGKQNAKKIMEQTSLV